MTIIIRESKFQGKELIIFFDTGSPLTIIKRSSIPSGTHHIPTKNPFTLRTAGKEFTINEMCYLSTNLNGKEIEFFAHIVNSDIGTDQMQDKEIDVLVGYLVMEMWGIIIDPQDNHIEVRGMKLVS